MYNVEIDKSAKPYIIMVQFFHDQTQYDQRHKHRKMKEIPHFVSLVEISSIEKSIEKFSLLNKINSTNFAFDLHYLKINFKTFSSFEFFRINF